MGERAHGVPNADRSIVPGDSGTPISFGPDGEPTHVRVIPLYHLVKAGWDNFDKSKVNPRFDAREAPNTPAGLTGSPNSSLVGVTGCVTTAKP